MIFDFIINFLFGTNEVLEHEEYTQPAYVVVEKDEYSDEDEIMRIHYE